MSDARFRGIAARFGTLSNELKDCTDPARRLDLLKEFRAVLAEADRFIADESAGERLRMKMQSS